ncbi:hypothetical protein O165_005430 [Pseudomonas soli]|nr:hypothetical protein O165_005430 [Pseudomonas soli]
MIDPQELLGQVQKYLFTHPVLRLQSNDDLVIPVFAERLSFSAAHKKAQHELSFLVATRANGWLWYHFVF